MKELNTQRKIEKTKKEKKGASRRWSTGQLWNILSLMNYTLVVFAR
jgi:hypothetical protein